MKNLLFASLLVSGSVYATDALIDVSNVRMSQDVSTRSVTVKYNLSITNSEETSIAGAVIRLDVLTNSPSGYVSIGRQYLETLSGDYSPSANSLGTGKLIEPGTDRTIVWDAKRDFPGRRLDDVKVAVKAYYPGEFVCNEWKYLMIDVGVETTQPTTYNWTLTDLNPDEFHSNGDTWKITASEIWFVSCPAGSFTMGAPDGAVAYQSARPQHKVTLTQPFFMEITPMTMHQWSRVANYTYSTGGSAQNNVKIDDLMGANWYSTRVIDASSVVGKIRARSGLNVTMPTEAQWEYACRAGSKGTYTGTDVFFTTANERNAYYQNAFGVSYKTYDRNTSWTSRTNAWGIAGMHTSIATWCQDTQDAVSTADAVDPLTKGSSAGFVLRGPWKWSGQATCHDYVSNSGLGHSFADDTIGARLIVIP